MDTLLIKKEVKVEGNITNDSKLDLVVLVITYNHGKFIRKCLESIISQKVRFNFKIYIGEDESTDETREICLNYSKKFPDKIVVFLNSQENNLVIGGNRTGRFNWLFTITQIRSKYIAICEGDDFWLDENKLQKQFNILEGNDSLSICGHDSFILKGDKHLDTSFTTKQCKKQIETGTVSLFTYLYPGFFMHTSSFFFRNTFNYVNKLSLNSLVGDLPLFLMAASNGQCYYISECLSVYRLNEKSFTNSNSNTSTKMLLSYGLTYLRAMKYFSVRQKMLLLIGFIIRIFQLPYSKFIAKIS